MVSAMLAKACNPVCNPWRCLAGAWCLLIGSIASADAHPHMWIDLRSQIVMQGDGQVSAIYQEWLFDDFFSTALIEEAAQNPEGVGVGIIAEVQRIVDNLQAYDYFTLVSVDDANVRLGVIESFKAELRENRIWISFSVPVSDHINVQTQTLSYAIFDPTYYIEMYHFENETVAFQVTRQRDAKPVSFRQTHRMKLSPCRGHQALMQSRIQVSEGFLPKP